MSVDDSEEREKRRGDELVLSGGDSLSVLSGTLVSCLTLCRVHYPPGGSEAGVHHLVVGGEADVKCVSVAHQVFRGYMAAVCA